jgi:hypothetical protein
LTTVKAIITKIEDAGTFQLVHLTLEETGEQVTSLECIPDIEELGIEVGDKVEASISESYDNEYSQLEATYMIQSKVI